MRLNFKKISFILSSLETFYEIFIKLRSFFNPCKIIYQKLLQYCSTIYITYIPILKNWWLYIFVIIFNVFVVRFYTSVNRVTYSSSNTFFLPLMIYGYQLQDLILLWFILKLFAMLNLMQKENEHDQANIFQETYLESSQIHQLAILRIVFNI